MHSDDLDTIDTPELEIADVAEMEDVDSDEAEYREAMKQARGDEKPPSEDDDFEDDESLSDEEREYRAEMRKARGEEEEKSRTAEKDKNEAKKQAENAPDKDESKKEAKEHVVKLKVDGEEIEYDTSNKEKLVRDLQKSLVADKRMDYAHRIENSMKNLVQSMGDPIEVERILSHPKALGSKEKMLDWAEKLVFKHRVQRAQMSQEEIDQLEERERQETELQQLRREKAEREAREKEETEASETAERRAELQQEFISALTDADIPKTDWTILRTAQYMRQAAKIARDQGRQVRIRPEHVMKYVKADYINHLRQTFGTLSGEELIELMGDETTKKVREANLKRYESSDAPKAKASSPKPKKKEKTYGSVEEMLRAG